MRIEETNRIIKETKHSQHPVEVEEKGRMELWLTSLRDRLPSRERLARLTTGTGSMVAAIAIGTLTLAGAGAAIHQKRSRPWWKR